MKIAAAHYYRKQGTVLLNVVNKCTCNSDSMKCIGFSVCLNLKRGEVKDFLNVYGNHTCRVTWLTSPAAVQPAQDLLNIYIQVCS